MSKGKLLPAFTREITLVGDEDYLAFNKLINICIPDFPHDQNIRKIKSLIITLKFSKT